MNKVKLLLTGLILAASLIFITGCNDEEETKVTVTSAEITEISTTSAVGGGDVSVSGGTNITERGVVWSENPSPTTAGSKAVASGTDVGSFTVLMTGLLNSTEYFARAYVINGGQTFYGNEVTFSTSQPIELIVNGDFSTPDDANATDLNSATPWKTVDNGDYVGRAKDGTEFVAWQSQYGETFFQTAGTVPPVATEYDISMKGRIDWTYWGDYDPIIAVRFSAYSGSDPSTRTEIGKSLLTFDFDKMYSWEEKVGDFNLTAAQAEQFDGQNLLIEFEVLNALEAYGYDGADDADVWFSYDKISVKQN